MSRKGVTAIRRRNKRVSERLSKPQVVRNSRKTKTVVEVGEVEETVRHIDEENEVPMFEKPQDTTGSAAIQRIRCGECESYYNITWKDQEMAARYLQSLGYEVSYLGSGIWKVKESNADKAKEEFVHPKGLIGRANFHRYRTGDAIDENAAKTKGRRKGKKTPPAKRPRKRGDGVEVPSDSKRPVGTLRKQDAGNVDSTTDKRRRKQKRSSGNGRRTSKAVREPNKRTTNRTRSAAKTVGKQRSSVPKVEHNNSARKKALERGRKRAANLLKSGRTGRRS